MPRPCKKRKVRSRPNSNYFKPAGIPMSELKEIELTLEEFESLKLIDVKMSSQSEAAEKMEVSQPSFSRTLQSARRKLSEAIINGKAIKIERKN